MAHLWMRDGQGEWAVLALSSARVPLSSGPSQGESAPPAQSASASVVPVTVEGRTAWVLLVADADRVRVNGRPVPARLRVLRDRDEIRIGPQRFFFSAEERAEVRAFAGEDETTSCPRCKQPLRKGDPSVRCPGMRCGVSYHASEELPCWTYTDSCALCGHPTSPDAGYQFCPEDL